MQNLFLAWNTFVSRESFNSKLLSKNCSSKNNATEVERPIDKEIEDRNGRVEARKGWCKFLTRRTILFPISTTDSPRQRQRELMFASVQARNATLRFYTIRRTTSRGSVIYEDGIEKTGGVEGRERVLTTSQVFSLSRMIPVTLRLKHIAGH